MSASPPASLIAAAQVGGVQAAGVEIATFHVKYLNVKTPLRDGVKLAGDLYLPAINGVPDDSQTHMTGRQYPCVLIRTPYNKNKENPDLRNPGLYWTQNSFACFIQDVRGRFASEGTFYKYTGEAEDGYDTVQWIAEQPWCNGSVATEGPSYLTHVQTSMALLRPPALKAMFANKGGFFSAFTSGVRNGGAYEARQWVWGVKNASRKNPVTKAALEHVESCFGDWMKRYPFKRGDSPLAASPDYEDFIFDQASAMEYGPYWQQIGLDTSERLDDFHDVPVLWLSGWYDIYARSTVDFFCHLVDRKKGPHVLIMGPWQHVGPEDHVAGDVDFGVNSLISGNLAPSVPSLARRWFDRFVTPATAAKPRKLTPQQKLELVISAAEQQQAAAQGQRAAAASGDFSPAPSSVCGPYTSLSRIPITLSSSNNLDSLKHGPSLYVLPAAQPRDRPMDDGPLPPPVRYFRMGGGDGHKTSQGMMFHGGAWMAAASWPPAGTVYVNYYLGKRTLTPHIYDELVLGKNVHSASSAGDSSSSGSSGSDSTSRTIPRATAEGEGETGEVSASLSQLDMRGEGEGGETGGGNSSSSGSGSTSDAAPYRFASHVPPASLTRDSSNVSVFDYDPRNPCPSIGGNVFGYRDVLLAGAFDQVERAGHFLCKPPYLPLSSRRDVVVFRTPPLREALDVTGMVVVKLVIASSAVDTDFTAKLVDEYPASTDYPAGYAMQITHGIRRCRFRDSCTKATLMEPGKAYEVTIELYPTSNLFAVGHRLRLDVSSSNFPHFDLNMNTGEEFESQRCVVAQNSIFHHSAYPSRLILPVQTRSQPHNGMMSEMFK